MGIMGGDVPYGPLAGLGQAMQQTAQLYQRKWADEDLIKARSDADEQKEMRIMEARERTRREGRQSDFDQDVTNAPKKNEMEAARTTAVGTAENSILADRNKTKLDQERADTIAKGSDPAYLAADRKLAQAKHIVDPTYTAVPTADGNLVMVDTHNPKNVVLAKNPDGTPLVRKDPEELKAISTALNSAKDELRVAEAAYKVDIQNAFEPAQKAAVEQQWKNAQSRYQSIAGPAMDKLFGKGKVDAQSPSSPPMQDVTVGGKVIGKAGTMEEAQAMVAQYKKGGSNPPQASAPPSGSIMGPSYNEAGYSTTDGTIAGAERGDSAARSYLARMLEEGGLTAQQKIRAQKALGQ